MKINFKTIALSICALLFFGAHASAQFSIAAAATNYTQDFSALTPAGTWTDNTTLTGWYARTTANATIATFGLNTGSTTTAGLYSFAVAGTNPLTDKSLGYVASNTFTGASGTGLGYFGYRLVNNTGSAISAITVTYTGEQWRKENNAAAHTINVDYQVGATVTNPAAGSWTSVPALTFTSPIVGATAAVVLDGNAPANRSVGITTTITVSIPAGQEIMIRFTDLNDASNDHYMAIDDVTINATAAASTTLSGSALATFGSQCIAGTYGPNMFTITGTNLTAANVDVGPFTGFQFATVSGGPYSNSLSLTQPGGAYSQDIYVNFLPVSAISYSGNIPLTGGGAAATSVAVTATGISTAAPTITTPASTGVGSTTATLGGNVTADNCSTVTIRGVEYSITTGFGNGTGTQVTETGTFAPGVFTLGVTGLSTFTTYFYKAFAVNGVDTTYTSEASFSTVLNVGDIQILGFNSNTTEDFAFVTWVSLPIGTKIKFTDNGFLAAVSANSTAAGGNGRGGEGFVSWTNTTASPIAAGTVIRISGTTASVGTATLGTPALAPSDQIIAYMGAGAGTSASTSDFGTNANPSIFTGSILYGLNYGNTGWLSSGIAAAGTSYLPTELNVANGNITFGATVAGGQYTATRTALGSLSAYKALVNNPANWTTISASTTVLDLTAFSVNPNPATQIAVTSINGGINPSVNTPFSVSIEVRDGSNAASSVAIDTDFTITLSNGTGAVTGTLIGTITAGSGTYTFTNVNYNVAEGGVILAVDATAGMTLTQGLSAAFIVEDAASQQAFVNVQSYAYTNNVYSSFTVEARRPNNAVDVNYNTGSATISLSSGTGSITGTLVQPFVNGVATFNDIVFDTPGVKQLQVASALPTATTSNITVSTPTLTEVIVPQFIQGLNGTNNNRIPYAYRVTIGGLQPNTTFRYINGMVEGADVATSNGAGNAIFTSGGSFTQGAPTSLATAGAYGTLTTDNSGNYTGWFISEPTGNARFTPNNALQGRIILNNGTPTGTFAAVRVTTTSTITVKNTATGATNGTALRGTSLATDKNFILAFDNEAGTGRPISATYVESDGFANTSSYSSFYVSNVDGVPGAYGMIVPNTLPNGIRRLEQRTLATGALITCPVMDSDGIWPSGANTVNPNGGTTAIHITATDASFDPSQVEVCGNEMDDDCDGLVDEGCPAPAIPNDAFNFAILAPVSGGAYPTGNCYAATLVGTSASPNGNPANVLPAGGQDLWYKFVATSTASRVVCTTSSMNVVLELHDALGVQVDVENDVANNTQGEIMVSTGLTPGATYYVAVRSYDGTLGAFNLCIQMLAFSGCADGSGTYDLCTNFKPTYSGANSYTFNFTPTGLTPGVPTSASATSQIALSNAALALRHGGTYDVTINGNFILTDAAGNNENTTLVGTSICSITIAPHADLRTKISQRCPATVFKGTTLQAKPFICGAINHTITFTEVGDCFGTSIGGLPFNTTTSGASSTKSLSAVGGVQAGKWYEVTWTPNFFYGAGTPGTTDIIYVAASSSQEAILEESTNNADEVEFSLYPNPNNGEMVNINITNVTSNHVFVRVMDSMGRVVLNERYSVDGSLNTVLSFNNTLSNGIYLVETTVDGQVYTERMVVAK
ncbi:MAG: T9SS type A sorting domain-containing protein [Flavobacteriales bacterium]